MTATEICAGCGLKTEKIDGPTHNYLGASAGCWARFGEVLAREYENYQYMAVHNLTVDAYALQHPGAENPQTIGSANVHLASLYSYFMFDTPPGELARVKQQLTQQKDNFVWLAPPQGLTAVTVADVLAATDATEHRERVQVWARYLFDGWKQHHATAAALLRAAGA